MIRDFQAGLRDVGPQPMAYVHLHGICTCKTYSEMVRRKIRNWALVAIVVSTLAQIGAGYLVVQNEIRQITAAGRIR